MSLKNFYHITSPKRAKAEKYAKILSKSIINASGEISAYDIQNLNPRKNPYAKLVKKQVRY